MTPSTALAAALARRNVHYGWVVVGVTFLTLLVTAAAMGMPGVLIVPLEKEFGWDNAQISSALAIRIMLFGLFGPFAAAFMNRFGVRRVIIVAMALIAGGLLASLAMTQVWQLILLWGIVVGVGTGLTAMVLAATVATRWFNHRRGVVVGMLAASSATGQLVFLPLIAELTSRLGWRAALIFVAGMLAFVALVASLLMHDRPSDLNLPLYGESKITPRPAEGVGLVSLLMAPVNVLKDAARVPIFWVLFGTFFVCGCSTNGLISDPFHHAMPRLWLAGGDRGERARDDGHFRLLRHHRLRLAVRPLRQSLAVVLVLRAARPFAALPALHRFHVLRPFAVRCVLRSRLDRHHTADRETDGRPLRPGEGRHGVRVGVCRPPDWCRQCGVRRWSGSHGIFDVSPGLLRRRCALPHRGGTCSDGAKTVGAGNWQGRAGARLKTFALR